MIFREVNNVNKSREGRDGTGTIMITCKKCYIMQSSLRSTLDAASTMAQPMIVISDNHKPPDFVHRLRAAFDIPQDIRDHCFPAVYYDKDCLLCVCKVSAPSVAGNEVQKLEQNDHTTWAANELLTFLTEVNIISYSF